MYHCSHCDAQSLKWQGRCSECGKWGTLIESGSSEAPASIGATKKQSKKGGAAPAPLLELSSASKQKAKHEPTNIPELDRVLSGGIVPGSILLLAGEPGIGKSTLVAQIADSLTKSKQKPVLYISGEESEGQVLMRFKRLSIEPKQISFSNTVQIDSIIAAADQIKPQLVIIDSIQTMIPADADNLPGSPTAVRAATSQLIGFAKSTNVPVLLIGQVTKQGSVAGPKTLEHLVDTVITLEGDKKTSFRMMHIAKHRFGSTDEIGVFEMTESGMIPVENPSKRFLAERVDGPGSVITCIMEGNRPFLVEIQALVEQSHYPNPLRRASGVDSSRLHMLLAIISKRAGISLSSHDVYVNVIGGMKIKETAADLAIIAAIISSFQDKLPKPNSVYIGEVGLSGELRNVSLLEKRIKEAERMGFEHIITSKDYRTLKEAFTPSK